MTLTAPTDPTRPRLIGWLNLIAGVSGIAWLILALTHHDTTAAWVACIAAGITITVLNMFRRYARTELQAWQTRVYLLAAVTYGIGIIAGALMQDGQSWTWWAIGVPSMLALSLTADKMVVRMLHDRSQPPGTVIVSESKLRLALTTLTTASGTETDDLLRLLR